MARSVREDAQRSHRQSCVETVVVGMISGVNAVFLACTFVRCGKLDGEADSPAQPKWQRRKNLTHCQRLLPHIQAWLSASLDRVVRARVEALFRFASHCRRIETR